MSTFIKLNIGGTVFEVVRSTLTSEANYFTTLLSGNWDNISKVDDAVYIDKLPDAFPLIYEHLKGYEIDLPDENTRLYRLLEQDAHFYSIASLIDYIGDAKRHNSLPQDIAEMDVAALRYTYQYWFGKLSEFPEDDESDFEDPDDIEPEHRTLGYLGPEVARLRDYVKELQRKEISREKINACSTLASFVGCTVALALGETAFDLDQDNIRSILSATERITPPEDLNKAFTQRCALVVGVNLLPVVASYWHKRETRKRLGIFYHPYMLYLYVKQKIESRRVMSRIRELIQQQQPPVPESRLTRYKKKVINFVASPTIICASALTSVILWKYHASIIPIIGKLATHRFRNVA
jgi:hypothetical protein